MWAIKWSYTRGGEQFADTASKFSAIQIRSALRKTGATAEIWKISDRPIPVRTREEFRKRLADAQWES